MKTIKLLYPINPKNLAEHPLNLKFGDAKQFVVVAEHEAIGSSEVTEEWEERKCKDIAELYLDSATKLAIRKPNIGDIIWFEDTNRFYMLHEYYEGLLWKRCYMHLQPNGVFTYLPVGIISSESADKISKEENQCNMIADKLFTSAYGYGLSKEDILVCIKCLPSDLREGFIYTMKRIAEKSGYEGF